MPLSLSVPIALAPDGQLQRGDQADAVAQLVGVLASTSASFWPHAPWFGLLEQFESVRPDVQEHPRLADAINLALRELGAEGLRVTTVRTAAATYGERRFDLVMAGDDGVALFRGVQA